MYAFVRRRQLDRHNYAIQTQLCHTDGDLSGQRSQHVYKYQSQYEPDQHQKQNFELVLLRLFGLIILLQQLGMALDRLLDPGQVCFQLDVTLHQIIQRVSIIITIQIEMQVRTSQVEFDNLLFESHRQEPPEESFRPQEPQYEEIEFNQHSHYEPHSSDGVSFSQSFSKYGDSSLHPDKSGTGMEKELAQKDRQLVLKDAHIKQLTEFLNKKRTQQGTVNSVITEEFDKLHQEISKKEILLDELTKLLSRSEETAKERESVVRQQEKELVRLREKCEKAEVFCQQKDGLFLELQSQFEPYIQQMRKLQTDNQHLQEQARRLSQMISQNVSEYKPLKKQLSAKTLDMKTCPNCPGLKQKKEQMEVQYRSVSAKYEQCKKKLAVKDESIGKLRQQLLKLESTCNSKDKKLQMLNASLQEKADQLRVSRQKEDRVIEMEKRLKLHKQEIEKKESKIIENLNQITQKNKIILSKTKSENELKSKLQLETEKHNEAHKEVGVLSHQVKQLRQTVRSLEKETDALRGNRNQNDKKDSIKQETLRSQLAKLEKQSGDNDQLLSQVKKKLEETEKKLTSMKNKTLDSQSKVKQLQAQVELEKEKNKRLTLDPKKRSSESELQNKIKILEARVSSQTSLEQHQQLEDRIKSLETLLESKDREVQEMRLRLQLHESQELDNQISHDLIAFHLKDLDDDKNPAIIHLKNELAKKYELIESLKRDLEKKDRSMEFTMQQFFKAEREKLLMQQEGVRTRYTLEESLEYQEGDYDQRELVDKLEQLEHRNQELEDKNSELKMQLRQVEETKYRTSSSDIIKQTTNTKMETLMLKNQIKQLKEDISHLQSQRNRRAQLPQQMSKHQVVQAVGQLLRRVNKSSEMARTVSRGPEFLELLRRLERRREENIPVPKRRFDI